jgi:uncharacterized protein YndB with AHSA1/START domain
MKPITVTVEIDRPAAEVFAFVSDVGKNPRWQQGQRSCRWTSPAPHQLDATYDQTAHFLGRDVVSTFRVSEYEPGRRIRFVSTSGPFPIDESRTVEPLGEGRSRVTAVVQGDASRTFWMVAPLLRAMVRRSVRADYARLQRLLAGASAA